MKRTNVEMLKVVARALGEIREQVVFVGGATVQFYTSSPGTPEPRPTFDVDCIVAIASRAQYNRLEETIRSKGFQNDQSNDAPLCRWMYDDITLDLMPANSSVLGFTNEWYDGAIWNSVNQTLEDGQNIRIPSTPYFFATKLSALKNRGMADLRTSKDLEDIVYVLNNRVTACEEIQNADDKVRTYLRESFQNLLSEASINEAVAAVLDYGESSEARDRVMKMMKLIGSQN
jgi:predicted nucleotidyltransferase